MNNGLVSFRGYHQKLQSVTQLSVRAFSYCPSPKLPTPNIYQFISLYGKGGGMVEWGSEEKSFYIIIGRKGKHQIMRILEIRNELTGIDRTNTIFKDRIGIIAPICLKTHIKRDG